MRTLEKLADHPLAIDQRSIAGIADFLYDDIGEKGAPPIVMRPRNATAVKRGRIVGGTGRGPMFAPSVSEASVKLAILSGVPPIGLIAYTSRVKDVIKLGLLPHLDRGQGKSASVDFGSAKLLSTAVTMTLGGISRVTAVAVVLANADAIISAGSKLRIVLPSELPGSPVTVLVTLPACFGGETA